MSFVSKLVPSSYEEPSIRGERKNQTGTKQTKLRLTADGDQQDQHQNCSSCCDGVEETRSPTEDQRPYGRYCSPKVINELQLWNPRKKVISYALFEEPPAKAKHAGDLLRNFQSYLDSMQANVQQASLYYPDWIVRVSVFGFSASDQIIDQIVAFDKRRVEVVVCHSDSPLALNPGTKMIARFLVHDDPTVDVFISRDADSRFSPRELFAVNQWLSSNQMFHTMRDNPYHTVPILGGMFGMKQGCLGTRARNESDATVRLVRFTDLLGGVLQRTPTLIGTDQDFLSSNIWPLVKSNTLDHDIDTERCKGYGSAVCADWPMGADHWSRDFFVGQAIRSTEGVSPGYDCSLNCSLSAVVPV